MIRPEDNIRTPVGAWVRYADESEARVRELEEERDALAELAADANEGEKELEARIRELEAHRAAALEMSQRQRDRVRDLEEALRAAVPHIDNELLSERIKAALVPANEETAE